MSTDNAAILTRRSLIRTFAAAAVSAAPVYANAAGLLRGSGDIRRLRMHSGRTGESIDTIYWIDGKYIPEALKEITFFMRDWRNSKMKAIDPRTVDIMSAAHSLMEASSPYQLLSGYRSPETNAMLRSRSRGVAKKSLHMEGQAADLRISGSSISQMSKAAQSCSAGGVGTYYGSNFVHMDCGPVRAWRG